MGVQPGFEDLKPKRVIDINLIDSTVECLGEDGKFTRMGLYVSSTGMLMARPLPALSVDQLATGQTFRHHGVDQLG